MSKVGSLYREIRRRGVLQSAAMYIVGAWVILQAADVLFPGAGIPESAIRFVFFGTVLGFPLVMVFGWMYDIGAKGISRTPSASQLAADDSPSLRQFDFILLSGMAAVMVTLVLGVSTLVVSQVDTAVTVAHAQPVAENSIAVLPFVNMSDDPGGEYLADGIAEELLNELANVTTLHVAARTSSFYFKGKNEPISDIGRRLGVRTVLEGSVRRSGDRLRITAQLINAVSGYHLWSETFDRKVGDIFAIQEEIAEAITGALEVEVLGKGSSKVAAVDTESFDAYDYYLLGQYQREKRNPESLEKSIELFRKALAVDDRFALGYAALALAHLYQAYYSDLAPERVVELTTPLLEKSLELNPRLAKAHATRASVRLLVGDYAAADAGYRRALELKPNYSGAWSNLGFSLVRQSRLKEAAEAYARSESLDPLNPTGQYNIGALKMLTGHFEEGLAAYENVATLAPERVGTEAAVINWSVAFGRYEEAARWVIRLLEREPGSSRAAASVARIYANLGMWDRTWEFISRAYEEVPDKVEYIDIMADSYFRNGDFAGFYKFVADEYEKVDQLAPTRHSPTTKARYFWHGVAAINEGNYVQAVDDLTNAAGGPAGIENLVYDDITPIKYIAYALQQQGRDDEADELLHKCLALATGALDQGWATPTIHYRIAQVYALLDQSDDAIAQLRQAVDKGWRIAGDLEKDVLWYRMQDDVRFQAIVAKINDEMHAQRERVSDLLNNI